MDKNSNFFDIIKRISTGLYCPFCGNIYNANKISLIGIERGAYAISITCENCKTPIMFSVAISDKREKNFSVSPNYEEEIFSDEKITFDEIISFHELVNGFDGDFKKIFKKRTNIDD